MAGNIARMKLIMTSNARVLVVVLCFATMLALSPGSSIAGEKRPMTLRTPDDRFANLPGFPYAPHYVEVNGLRMHYLDEGQGDPILCLHGEPSWCYLYRKMIPTLSKGNRVVAADLIGLGRSDKPVERSAYTYAMHHDALTAFVKALDLKRITLVCQDWGGLLGIPLATEMPERFDRLVVMNTGLPTGEALSPAFYLWREFAAKSTDMDIGGVIQRGCVSKLSPEVVAAYNAPFPDARYKAGAHQFPLLVPTKPDDPGVATMRRSREQLAKWTKPVLVLFSDKDPITAGGDRFFRNAVPGARGEPETVVKDGGHFLQEDKGEEVAKHIREFLDRHPIR
jgi:haloalkane dehalogenase